MQFSIQQGLNGKVLREALIQQPLRKLMPTIIKVNLEVDTPLGESSDEIKALANRLTESGE